jgi:large subunit ribosomal protein L13
MSGLRQIPYAIMKAKHPERIIRHAVSGMMPKTKLGEAQLKRLRIFAESEHDLYAQKPITVEI